jgi:hypothetical protein
MLFTASSTKWWLGIVTMPLSGRTLVRDLSEPDWRRDLANDYDVVVTANAMHWFSLARAAQLFGDIFNSLRAGGAFLLMEPAAAESQFASGSTRGERTAGLAVARTFAVHFRQLALLLGPILKTSPVACEDWTRVQIC